VEPPRAGEITALYLGGLNYLGRDSILEPVSLLRSTDRVRPEAAVRSQQSGRPPRRCWTRAAICAWLISVTARKTRVVSGRHLALCSKKDCHSIAQFRWHL